MGAFRNLVNWAREQPFGKPKRYELYLTALQMAKNFSSRGISKHRSYSLEEAALIIGAHEQTLRYWEKHDGLVIMKSQKPYIVHGAVLIDHLEARKPKKRPRLPAGEFDCWTCKTRGKPFGMMADYIPLTPKTGRLKALCRQCGGDVATIVGKAKLAKYSAILEIVTREE